MRNLLFILALAITFVSCEKENDLITGYESTPFAVEAKGDANETLLGSPFIQLPENFTGVYSNGVGQYKLTAVRGEYPQNNQAPKATVRVPNGTDFDTYETTYNWLELGTQTTVEDGETVYLNEFRQLINEAYGFEIAGRTTAYQLGFEGDVPSTYTPVGIFNVGSTSAEWIIVQKEGAIFNQ